MKTISFLTFSFFFLLMACSSGKKDATISTEEPAPSLAGQLTIIFDKNPGNSWYYWPGGSSSGLAPQFEVRYVDDQTILRYFTPELAPALDTLRIQTERELIEVQHVYKGIDVLSYLLHNGDTVLFSYEEKKPFARVLNRVVAENELNYDLQKREQIVEGSFPGQIRMRSIFGFRDSLFMGLESFEEKVSAAHRVGKEAALREHRREQVWLDSLEEAGALSAAVYHFYKGKSYVELAQLPLASRMKNEEEEELFRLDVPIVVEGTDVTGPTFEELLQTRFDSLAYSIHYQELLKYVFQKHFGARGRVDWIRTSSSNSPDYRQVYDSIRQNNAISDQVKKLLLFRGIDEVIAQASVDDIDAYWLKFRQDVGDTAMLNYISRKYGLGEKTSKELQLKNLAGERLTFSSVLEQNKGKVVYVDFWASWCGPCIRALPASAVLHEAYKDSEVAFVYLSIDEEAAAWQKGAAKHKLQVNSYRVDNRFRSKLLDELALQSIPRYLLYDKVGRLVHKNAPGPGSEETRKLLNHYLSLERKATASLTSGEN